MARGVGRELAKTASALVPRARAETDVLPDERAVIAELRRVSDRLALYGMRERKVRELAAEIEAFELVLERMPAKMKKVV